MDKCRIFSIDVDTLSMQGTVDTIDKAIQSNNQIHHACINAGKVVLMQKDKQLFESVSSCNLINADGQAIVWASKLLTDKPIAERVSGVDLMYEVIKLASIKKYKVYFFGAKQQYLDKTVDFFRKKYGDEIIGGYRNGYFNEDEEINIANEIAKSGSQILFVAIKSPIKENFLYKNKEVLKDVPFIMGVGGSFDVVAGKVKRAPMWFQRNGMEWFYRLVQEPRKMWRRYLIGNLVFINIVLKEMRKK